MEHGIRSAFMDNLGGGWRIECLCGFMTCPDKWMENVGFEFDEHLIAVKEPKEN